MKEANQWFAGCLIAVVAILIGCSCGPGVIDRRTVIRVANWGGASDDSDFAKTVREIYREFERRNPDIRIQVEGIPGSQEYVSKVILSHISNSAPDVITLDASSAAVFIENGVLQDLSPMIAKDRSFRLDDYFSNVVDISRRGAAIYSVPMDFTPMVVYYNKALFDAADVPYPKPGWNRDDFLATAKALTRNEIYGFKFSTWMPGWVMWLWNSGGDVVDPGFDGAGTPPIVIDSPQNVRTVTWLRDLVTLHKVAPSLSETAATGVDPFANGQAAMEISGHWSIVGYQQAPKLNLKRIGIAPLPSELGSSVTVMYQSGLAIGKRCKRPDAAWKFIKYMSSREVQRKYHQSRIAISARKDVSSERASDPLERAFLDIVSSARGPWGAKVEGYDLIEDVGQKMMDGVVKQGIDPQAALRKARVEMERELARR